jgi:hypothetical protein
MAWRARYLSRRKPPAIPSYIAGALGGLGGAFGSRILFRDPGNLAGEMALALLCSIASAGLAVALVDLVAQHRRGTKEEVRGRLGG